MSEKTNERTCRIERWNACVRDSVLITVNRLSCGHVVEDITGELRYCPKCGARVVREEA